ncbi:MAG: response regulator [Chromatiales bacterium]|jgi:two-component system chemotaxis response regulator CheY|nr:response regulator [Chromatiales bacterium]
MASILIADDSPSMRRMVATTLRTAGHEVIEVEDGSAALSVAEQNSFDVIISDMNMPGMTGIELVEALRNRSLHQHAPILMLTTETSEDLKERARKAGASGWLGKPFNPEQLISVVYRVLARHSSKPTTAGALA